MTVTALMCGAAEGRLTNCAGNTRDEGMHYENEAAWIRYLEPCDPVEVPADCDGVVG